MSDLKDQLVKLGTSRKDLRKHIRPILAQLRGKQAGRYENVAEGYNRRVDETMIGKKIRVRWKRQSVLIEQLPDEGGRKLNWYTANWHYLLDVLGFDQFIYQNLQMDARISSGDSFKRAVKKLESAFEEAAENAMETHPKAAGHFGSKREMLKHIQIEKDKVYFTKVAPANTEEIVAEGEDFVVTVTWNKFKAYSPDSDLQNHDQYYQAITESSSRGARKLYKVLNNEPDALKRTSYDEFTDWLDKHKIKYDYLSSSWR